MVFIYAFHYVTYTNIILTVSVILHKGFCFTLSHVLVEKKFQVPKLIIDNFHSRNCVLKSSLFLILYDAEP